MPTFEFQFRSEFPLQQVAPRIEIEADRVFPRQMGDRIVVQADQGPVDGDHETVFSTASDRLLWWRPLPEGDTMIQVSIKQRVAPPDLPNPEPDTPRAP